MYPFRALGRALIYGLAVCLFVVVVNGQSPLGPPSEANHFIETPKGWTQPKTPWGDPDIQGMWPIPDVSSPKLAMESEKDRKMADEMSSYWVNFAKNGDPNGRGLPNWPRFKDRNAPPHILGEIKEHPSPDVLNVYDAKYAEVLTALTAATN